MIGVILLFYREWRKPGNEAIFKMEAGTKHGFNLRKQGEGSTDTKGELC